MARLPQPGSDSGTWGTILNDFLSQAHNNDGTIKDGVVPETALSSAAQTKLNAVAGTPDWSVITNKPAVVTNLTSELAAKADDTSVVHIAGTETITGQKAFAARTYTKEVYVQTTGGAGTTASVTLDNDNGQVYGVTNNSGGTFGVYDATHGRLPLAIQSDAPDIALMIDAEGVKVKDANFVVRDDGDISKQAKFQASAISTGTTRTYTLPDKSDTLATLSDIVSTGGVIKPEDYGAVGDGSTDDTTALQSTFDAATGKTVYLDPDKTYTHSQVLTISVSSVHVTGGGTLIATAEQVSAVHVSGSHITFSDIVLKMASTTQRWDANEMMKLHVSGDHFYGRDITVNGSAAAGIMFNGATSFTLIRSEVFGTRADGVHVTGGSRNGSIINCYSHDTGDDSFAVVSYEADGVLCENIVNSGSYAKNSNARGFSVVGGKNIRYYNGRIDTTSAAALYVACEPSYTTYGVSDVVIDGFEVTGANYDALNQDHGAVLIYNGRTASYIVSRVTVRNLTITDTDTDASRQVSILCDVNGADNIRDIIFDRFNFVGSGPSYRFDLYQVPVYRCQVDAALLDRRVYTTAAYQIWKGIDQVILIGPGGSAVLPTAVGNVNRYTIRNVDSSSKTVSTTGGQTVDGGASVSIAAGATVDILSDNANWFVLYP